MSTRKSVSRNFLALGSGEVISRLLAFAAIIYVARILGADNYGVIAFAVGINLYFSRIADFAIEWIGAREIARNQQSFEKLAAAIMGVRLTFSFIIATVSILLTWLFLPDPERYVLILYLVSMIPIAANTKWIHMGLEDAKPVGLSRIIGEALGLAVILFLLTPAAELWVPPVALVASESIMAAYLIITLRQRGYRLNLSLDMAVALPIFKSALPVLINLMLGLLIYNSDLIFLRMFRDSEHVGYYAAAYMLISFINNLGLSYGMSLLPALTRLGTGTDGEKVLYHTALAHIYAACLPLSVGGYLLADAIILQGFGDGYSGSALILQVLIWTIPMSMIRNVPWAALIARGRQDLLMKAILYAALANIILNILLIPMYGMLGAAAATIATEIVAGYFMHSYAANQGLHFVSLKRFIRPTVATLAMALAIPATNTHSLIINIVVGSVVYILVLAAVGGIRFKKGQLPDLNV